MQSLLMVHIAIYDHGPRHPNILTCQYLSSDVQVVQEKCTLVVQPHVPQSLMLDYTIWFLSPCIDHVMIVRLRDWSSRPSTLRCTLAHNLNSSPIEYRIENIAYRIYKTNPQPSLPISLIHTHIYQRNPAGLLVLLQRQYNPTGLPVRSQGCIINPTGLPVHS